MSKGVSFKDVLKKWESRKGTKAAEAREVKLNGNHPPICLLDPSISSLVSCEKLSLSTNFIEKLTNLNGLRSLKILSLGRNWIKSFAGLEVLSDTLEQLWISYNAIEKMKGIGALRNLKVLYMSNNSVKEWPEFQKLTELPVLEDLVFVERTRKPSRKSQCSTTDNLILGDNYEGNPIEERHTASGDWRDKTTNMLKTLKKLDGYPVIKKEETED